MGVWQYSSPRTWSEGNGNANCPLSQILSRLKISSTPLLDKILTKTTPYCKLLLNIFKFHHLLSLFKAEIQHFSGEGSGKNSPRIVSNTSFQVQISIFSSPDLSSTPPLCLPTKPGSAHGSPTIPARYTPLQRCNCSDRHVS